MKGQFCTVRALIQKFSLRAGVLTAGRGLGERERERLQERLQQPIVYLKYTPSLAMHDYLLKCQRTPNQKLRKRGERKATKQETASNTQQTKSFVEAKKANERSKIVSF